MSIPDSFLYSLQGKASYQITQKGKIDPYFSGIHPPDFGMNHSVKVKDLKFRYSGSEKELLNIAELNVIKGEHLFIEGPSGSGKTTFLNILAGVQRGQEGSVEMLGQPIGEMNNRSLDQLRADHMGIIFQLFNLIPYLSVIENILLPCSFSRVRTERVLKMNNNLESEAVKLSKALGLDDVDLKNHKAINLSVGQQQRVAAARALIGAPEIIIADEPTSALDQISTNQFMELLIQECDRNSSTLIFVSHDTSLKPFFGQSFSFNEMKR